MTTRKDKVKQALTTYFKTREDIFKIWCSTHDTNIVNKLNAKKHSHINEIFSYFNLREKDIITEKFQAIIANTVSGCQSLDMTKYLKSCNANPYYNCLSIQHQELQI